MSRRDAIIVAVLINACLLTLLFVSAVTHKEPEIVQQEPIEPRQIMSQQVDEPPVLVESRKPSLPKEETKEEIVHKLPSMETDATAVLPPPVKNEEKKKDKEVVIKKGDSLEKIAKRHNCSVKEIVSLNQLNSSFLRIGQVLKIPEGKITNTNSPRKQEEQKQIVTSEYYTVKSGDNPWTIAMKHHMKVEELLKLNHLNEQKAKKLKPGDKLRIR